MRGAVLCCLGGAGACSPRQCPPTLPLRNLNSPPHITHRPQQLWQHFSILGCFPTPPRASYLCQFFCDGSLEASLIPRSGPRVTAVPPRQSRVPQQRSREASGTGHGRGRPLPAARGNCTRLLRAGRQISCPRLSREVLISSVKNT